jgi:hypothetical protein
MSARNEESDDNKQRRAESGDWGRLEQEGDVPVAVKTRFSQLSITHSSVGRSATSY